MKITFLGATGTVTGSKYLVEDEDKKVLIDCGLFQGLKELRMRNWRSVPLDLKSLDAVILTHAHIDHSGYLPVLVRDGFTGPIYCSSATADLCDILLPDSGRLHEEDAKRANKYGYTKHKQALPLYTEEDAFQALEQIRPVAFGDRHALGDFLSFSLSRVGHILGASAITIGDGQTDIVFSGDLGRKDDPIMNAPAQIQQADYLVLESTYGDRLHKPNDPLDKLQEIINRTVQRGGTVVIPAFAVGRAQNILYYIHELKKNDMIPNNIPVFLDSPMSINATELLQRHKSEHKLGKGECHNVCHVAQYLRTAEESKTLNNTNGVPKIIISASGMATGGRILHHLKHFIGDKKNTILFAGYQASNTRGARLVHGETEIKIHGHLYPVRADIEKLDNMSAHADYKEILEWLSYFKQPPKQVFLTHGEPEAASSLKFKIEEHLGWQVEIPSYQDSVEI